MTPQMAISPKAPKMHRNALLMKEKRSTMRRRRSMPAPPHSPIVHRLAPFQKISDRTEAAAPTQKMTNLSNLNQE